MLKYNFAAIIITVLTLIYDLSCTKDSDGSAPELDLPVLKAEDIQIREGDVDDTIRVRVLPDRSRDANSVFYAAGVSGSAESSQDFVMLNAGKIVLAPEDTVVYIYVVVKGDEIREPSETFVIRFYNPVNARFLKEAITVTILDDDDNAAGVVIPSVGYTTPQSYTGMRLVWADEFDSTALNPNNWVHETGAGGWGNQELQYYRPDNTSLLNGNLVITAKAQRYGQSNYTSSRIVSRGKKAFKFGRVDIRASLPKGQGLWPALWMLGTNITSVGWPSCGEIDIMELSGNLPNRVLGSVHFGSSPEKRQIRSMPKYLSGNNAFHNEFHVFSIIWKENIIEFLVDDEKYFTITPQDMGNELYPFNKNFFFIMNVAVGGNFPGSPDPGTPFPQHMIVDYIRVFQPL